MQRWQFFWDFGRWPPNKGRPLNRVGFNCKTCVCCCWLWIWCLSSSLIINPCTTVQGHTPLTCSTLLKPRPNSDGASVPGAWIYCQLTMTLNCVAKRRLVRLKTKPVVVTQSLSTLVMTSLATQMHFRYQYLASRESRSTPNLCEMLRTVFSISINNCLFSEKSAGSSRSSWQQEIHIWSHEKMRWNSGAFRTGWNVIITDKIILKNAVRSASVNHRNV